MTHPASLPDAWCSTEGVRALVGRTAQACFLLRVLAEHNIGRLAARLDDAARGQLRGLRFRCAAGKGRGMEMVCTQPACARCPFGAPHLAPTTPGTPAPLHPSCSEWVSSEDGEGSATQLISVLVAEHLSATGAFSPAGWLVGSRFSSTCRLCCNHLHTPCIPSANDRPLPLLQHRQAAWPRTWRRRCRQGRAPTSAKTTSCITRQRGCCSAPSRRRPQVRAQVAAA